jgi:hypothetical protein
MHKDLQAFAKWTGEWVGHGETINGVPINTRMSVTPRMAGEMLEYVIENLHQDTGRLVHGVIGHMAVDPDGMLRMAVCSTIHGCIVTTMTPEDPGAGAIEGTSVTGNRVIVSLVQEDSGLMLTSYWKTPAGEQVGYTNIMLKRVAKA